MREIKFRAFDKKENDMIYGVLPLSDGTFLIENANSEKFCDVYCDDNITPNNYVIMQYTGLKDKNGKEIYEGDILFGGKKESKKYRWQMVWNDYGRWEASTDSEFSISWKGWEVIGNIHENPDLLN